MRQNTLWSLRRKKLHSTFTSGSTRPVVNQERKNHGIKHAVTSKRNTGSGTKEFERWVLMSEEGNTKEILDRTVDLRQGTGRVAGIGG